MTYYRAMNQDALCWIDQQIISAGQARVSVFDHGLLYGDGVFEGLRFYHNKVFMLEAHLQRLQASADAISLELPCSLDEIAEIIAGLIEQYRYDDGYLRLVVTRGRGNLGVDPRKCDKPTLFLIADQLAVLDTVDYGPGIGLHIARTRRFPADCLDPAIKSLNYLNNILARIEASHAGMDEALMLNLDGNVCEGSVDNIFIVKDGVLKTPPLSDGMLAGVTRAVIIEAAAQAGIPCEQVSLSVADLREADECFLTGTGAELIPVGRIDDYCLAKPLSPLMPVIVELFRREIENYCTN